MAAARDAFGDALAEVGDTNRDLVALNADLSGSTKTSVFEKRFPDRFFNVGIAEQNMIGMAAGLALAGKIPVASTFAVFLTGRVYDFIRQSVAYPHLNVKLVASHAGITVGGDGASHQMVEDLALMRALPHMHVVSPADACEAVLMTRYIINELKGPVYMRMGRAATPVIFDDKHHFRFGKADILVDGADVTIAATGTMVHKALEAEEVLRGKGISARVLNFGTIKPIDKDAILKAATQTKGIVTAEEHSVIGGLGSAIAEVVVENRPVHMHRVGVQDQFGESGQPDELMDRFGLTTGSIVMAAERLLKS
jgi:transketolase